MVEEILEEEPKQELSWGMAASALLGSDGALFLGSPHVLGSFCFYIFCATHTMFVSH